jgi:N-methylhydantoinase B/oxoprolinase/acetone carboxylase alpha subunit
VARVKTQTVPGRIRKSQFKDLAMKGKPVLLAKQDVDCMFNLPMELTINADASVDLSLAGASGTVPFGENISPTALKSGLMMGYSHIIGFDMFNSGPISAWNIEMPPDGSWANPYPLDYQAASGVAWAPAVTWVSSLYEVFGRLFQMRGFIEEMAAGSGTIMTAEFSGINQTGMYLTGLTLEQASQGSPARGFADGENSAWCIYTPEADFGNAEISELYYPILFLGRNVAPDSGGFGQFRGGLGHTAVWMVYNTPGLEYQCGDAGMRSKIVGNHGMYGAYPAVPDRPGYGHDTNVKELIDAQKPLIHERGGPENPAVAMAIEARDVQDNMVAPFVTPEPLQDYDIIVHPIAGAEAMGDPISRDPASVIKDLNEGWTSERVASEIYGVAASKPNGAYVVDEAKTEKRREKIRKKRLKRAVPFKDWWEKEREKVQGQKGMDPAVIRMWAGSMALSPKYAEELRRFWNLPSDFTFGS